MNYVIIGNSAAAIGCVEGIRQQDSTGAITILSDEPHHTYSRPLISYLLYGKTDEKRMRYRSDSFYTDNGCQIIYKAVTAIHPEEKALTLEDGTSVSYDKLLVATGSSPFIPAITGLEGVQSKHTFMTLDDAKALDAAVGEDTRVLILGAGLIGLKCAEGLSKKTSHITVVDLAGHILPSILDADSAEIMAEHMRAKGIDLILSDSVTSFAAHAATLNSGNTVPFDVLVLAVGVRPNTALVARAGGEVNRGVVTDELCRTTLPDVYAAGDCAESYDISREEARVLALLPGAYMQGECAGINMAGGEKHYDKALPMNAIGFFGKHIITAGSYDGEEYRCVTDVSYKRLFYKDNLLKGYILMGDVARAGIYTALIRDSVPLDTVDFALIKDKPQLMAFSKLERLEKLGGVCI